MGGCWPWSDPAVSQKLQTVSIWVLHHNIDPLKYLLRGFPIRLGYFVHQIPLNLLSHQAASSIATLIVLFEVFGKHIPLSAIIIIHFWPGVGLVWCTLLLGIGNWDGIVRGVYKIQFSIFGHVNGNQKDRITLLSMFYTSHIELNKWKSKYDWAHKHKATRMICTIVVGGKYSHVEQKLFKVRLNFPIIIIITGDGWA